MESHRENRGSRDGCEIDTFHCCRPRRSGTRQHVRCMYCLPRSGSRNLWGSERFPPKLQLHHIFATTHLLSRKPKITPGVTSAVLFASGRTAGELNSFPRPVNEVRYGATLHRLNSLEPNNGQAAAATAQPPGARTLSLPGLSRAHNHHSPPRPLAYQHNHVSLFSSRL